ncbi:VOC family protein [Algihabitans albus]|uniref:VOC family protein n=1 Tax=Algihabitans albus TaxID=2164067 RepID=UPI000E5D4B7B|nr:VOC family protein [Algihabitans albus]
MQNATLEHVNVTVSDPQKTAEMVCRFFDWKIRWQGPSTMGGQTIHVGTDDAYLAVYANGRPPETIASSYHAKGGLNHIGVVVANLDAVEGRVKQAGYATYGYDDYDPGRRFYFRDADGIEFEVVSYAPKTER